MRIGLLYAMKGEIESMLTEETPLLQEKAGVSFYRIRENIIACCGGVGKVNAAMATQLFIDLYHPDLMMNVGVAGSFEDLPIGTLVLPDRFMQHDMDTSGIGDPVGLISTVNRMDFPTARQDEARAALDGMGITYRVGSVATGDWFATECDRARWIADTFRPLLIEMEGCAAAQVCWRNDVEFLALKSVSDCVLAHHDFYFNFPQAMRDLNKTALPLAERLLDRGPQCAGARAVPEPPRRERGDVRPAVQEAQHRRPADQRGDALRGARHRHAAAKLSPEGRGGVLRAHGLPDRLLLPVRRGAALGIGGGGAGAAGVRPGRGL